MASAKIATLLIRTLAKPISNQIKQQVKEHERFRSLCVNLAQFMYRSETNLRQNILAEPAKHVRPLSEAKAIENGANALAEGFLFSVAAGLIVAETWRSSWNESKRRDSVNVRLEELGMRITQLTARVDDLVQRWKDEQSSANERYKGLAKILPKVVENKSQEQIKPLPIGIQPPQSKGISQSTSNTSSSRPISS
ncbi:optic atrophy 3 protein-domain-containing protein [Gymnopilus junonius]|uniref:Optic atrophy 3 protein-domain-containing protein n=1 Tax=Gymnopilus junonius TaxID=109634 RepID=A0A9P5NC28_GYMJU|nr:optic atrophy 3 protein-domain-containing protein [Gymnopilus junonius]